MSSLAIRMLPEPIRVLAFGTIDDTYMGVGSALENPSRLLLFTNDTDAGMMISYDSIEDHLAVPSKISVVLDISSNKSSDGGMYVAQNTRFYVKNLETGVGPSVGSFYISTFYGIDAR